MLSQSIPAKNGWFLKSSIPFCPSRCSLLQMSLRMRSFALSETSVTWAGNWNLSLKIKIRGNSLLPRKSWKNYLLSENHYVEKEMCKYSSSEIHAVRFRKRLLLRIETIKIFLSSSFSSLFKFLLHYSCWILQLSPCGRTF